MIEMVSTRRRDLLGMVVLVLGLLCGATNGLASPPTETRPNDAAALEGLESVRTVFLVNKATAGETARYLRGIRATHESLKEQNVTPSTVVVFLGPPVQFITTAPAVAVAAENSRALESIAETTSDLETLGVRMEVCAAATKHFGVDNDSLLPGMEAVGNGFISMIGWQSKDYVPMTF